VSGVEKDTDLRIAQRIAADVGDVELHVYAGRTGNLDTWIQISFKWGSFSEVKEAAEKVRDKAREMASKIEAAGGKFKVKFYDEPHCQMDGGYLSILNEATVTDIPVEKMVELGFEQEK